MAHIETDMLPPEQDTYQLGEYEFYLLVSPSPPEHKTYISAQCSKGEAQAVDGVEIDGDAEVIGWYVEADETEASVYATVKINAPEGPDIPAPFYKPVPCSEGSVVGYYRADSNRVLVGLGSDPVGTAVWTDDLENGTFELLLAQSDNPNPFADFLVADAHHSYVPGGTSYTYNGLTVYYCKSRNTNYSGMAPPVGYAVNMPFFPTSALGPIAWNMVYGNSGEDEEKEVLVARFAIDPEDAGADDPESDWEDPEDSGDPDLTLDISAYAALSGRHNDPLDETASSYYHPADQRAQTVYGSGGDGGNGGGGGAGASTLIVYDFPTDRAGSKSYHAYIKRHGYGSGGGRGGTGGDGCILVYY